MLLVPLFLLLSFFYCNLSFTSSNVYHIYLIIYCVKCGLTSLYVCFNFRMVDQDDVAFFMRFFHKGQFLKTKYHCGACVKIKDVMETDKFSYYVIMEYVKGDVGYTEIGGVYVKKKALRIWIILYINPESFYFYYLL